MATPTDRQAMFQEGLAILGPLLESHGFRFQYGPSGPSSGGEFVSGAYERGNRSLEFHLRYSLGLVTYRIGSAELSHVEFMRLQPEVQGRNQYPGFSDDPLDGFRHLRSDLENYGSDFLSGSGRFFSLPR